MVAENDEVELLDPDGQPLATTDPGPSFEDVQEAPGIDSLAIEVLEGKWGASTAGQVNRLRKAGHNASAVMAEVAKLR